MRRSRAQAAQVLCAMHRSVYLGSNYSPIRPEVRPPMSHIREIVIARLSNALQRRGIEVVLRDAHHLRHDLGISSLQMVTLITGLCKELNNNVFASPTADLSRIATVSDLIALFGGYVGEVSERTGDS